MVGRLEDHRNTLIEGQFSDPYNRPIKSHYVLRHDDVAVIESAAIIGLALVAKHDRNPLQSSSRGVGAMLGDALNRGATRVLIGCGDTATSDCGIGLMSALGCRFYDVAGNELPDPRAHHLSNVHSCDLTGARRLLHDVPIELACNLSSIAGGPGSTVHKYARQKGASDKDIAQLIAGYENFISIVADETKNPDVGIFPGSGAAGGVGLAVQSVARSYFARYSFETTFEAIHLKDYLQNADLMITGEGLFDEGSVKGKAPVAAALYAKSFNTRTLAIVGAIQDGAMSMLLRSGFDLLEPLSGREVSVDSYISNFDVLAREAVTRGLLKFAPILRESL